MMNKEPVTRVYSAKDRKGPTDLPRGQTDRKKDRQRVPSDEDKAPADRQRGDTGRQKAPADERKAPADRQKDPKEDLKSPAERPRGQANGPAGNAKGPSQKPKGPAGYAKGPAKKGNGPSKNAKGPAKKTNGPAKNAKGPAKKGNGPAKNAKGPAKNTKGAAKEKARKEKKAQKQVCPRCGAEPLPWQRFCADCGAKLPHRLLRYAPAYLDPGPEDDLGYLPMAEDRASDGTRGTKRDGGIRSFMLRYLRYMRRPSKLDAVGIAEVAVILLLIVAVSSAAISRTSFGGSYVLISDGPAQTYFFDENGYLYTDAEKQEQGGYWRKKNAVTLIDPNGRKSVLIHDGSYLYTENARYDNKFVRGEREQTLKRVISLMYQGGTLRTERTLELRKDHTCRVEVATTFIGDALEEPIVREGTYRLWGRKLILHWNDGFTEVERVLNGFLYYSIYQKQ